MSIVNPLNISSTPTDGKIPIGDTATGYPAWANITSSGNTITITNGANTINMETAGSIAGSFPTDSGTATPSAGVLTVAGAHNINTSGAGSTVTVHGNNTITLGDLASVAGSDAITVTTGNITVTAGNLNMPNTSGTGGAGIIKFGGDRWISNYGTVNTFVGDLSGNTTNTSSNNTCVGQTTGFSLTTGSSNTFLGSAAGWKTTSGSDNVAIGNNAMFSFISGAGVSGSNTAVGDGSLESLTTGVSNTCIGSNAGSNYTGAESSNVLLGASGVLGESNVMRLGTTGGGTGQVNKAWIAGTYGVTPAVSGTNQMVISNDQGQFGTQAIPGFTSVVTYTGVNHAASPYTVGGAGPAYYISADVTAGVVTLLFPNAPTTGTTYVVKDKVGLAATSNITVTTVGGAVNIDGATSFVMNTNFESIQLIYSGSAYEVY